MENGIRRKTEEGSPQGGPLSPLLANIYLNEFDQEMKSRGVTVIRYADDIVVLAKSKVVSVVAQKHFKFLGFALGKNGRGV
ncbi:reverse transcriptase domain-containing protein [Paenibacillus maysiensis]|uniref:reverse transcriptase domain-containing protein n=1 Tax=Paenibacillus maysiensis TaxID=1155954 RepID=UPI00046FB0CC|nr:reverse transcriptase domain-containing protein [Paenibacillus maysiensis]